MNAVGRSAWNKTHPWAASLLITLLCLGLGSCGGGGGGTSSAPPPPVVTPVSVNTAQALWVSTSTIAWPGVNSVNSYTLYAAAAAGIVVKSDGSVTGADSSVSLGSPAALTGALASAYPQLRGDVAFTVPASAQSQAATLLKDQLILVETSGSQVVRATALQIQGALDDVYGSAASTHTLGLSIAADETPTFRVWAPTARSVSLNVNANSYLMTLDASSGVWSYTGNSAWTNSATYSFTLQVYARTDGDTVRTYTVTDPYAVTLTANVFGGPAQLAMVADLGSASTRPVGWNPTVLPLQIAPTDNVLYELHVRDFSASDATVSSVNRGKFLAFTEPGSNGMKHLQQLAAAGVTHVHLLPVFDINTVNEGGCITPLISNTDPVGPGPQATQAASTDTDCYNWGYDPHHYGAPAGFYSSDGANPLARVLEFRSAVQSLHNMGLSVVMDVVYNHTSGNFLDQIVPGYYYRLDSNGNITTTSCCQDTATEHTMMEKLMTDTLKVWAVQYMVDGFRFDTMQNQPLAVMQRAKLALDAAIGPLRRAYWYGEGFVNSENFVQADQVNLAGSSIGSFNDRIRDAVRGGGPFDSGISLVANQGFVSGQCWGLNTDSNGAVCATGSLAQAALFSAQDLIRVSMAAGLQNFNLNGTLAKNISYYGNPAGYALNPQEVVNYVGSHDGQTLYDISQYKHAIAVSSADRARAQVVALGTMLMAQGVPFIHAGDELLRSKGFDQNSYNSGDWFNRIDWSGTTNFFATMGLPPAGVNGVNWNIMTPFLQAAWVNPSAADIAATNNAVLDLLKVRKGSSMFRLPTTAQVLSCLSFPDAAAQQNGLIVMQIGRGGTASCGDNAFNRVVVLVNANSAAQVYTVPTLIGHALRLHPVQVSGSDTVVKSSSFTAATGRFQVSARSVAVFVE